jgi:hypothetical protein
MVMSITIQEVLSQTGIVKIAENTLDKVCLFADYATLAPSRATEGA